MISPSKPLLFSFLVCPTCGGTLNQAEASLSCIGCGLRVTQDNGKPIFTPVPSGIVPSVRRVRGPNVGTLWRRANWAFFERMTKDCDQSHVVLDVGAGRGDFKDIFKKTNYIAVDIYPYEEVDFVCDLTKVNPLKSASVDVVILSNVLEHVFDGRTFLGRMAEILKPDGRLLIAVPFIIKIHQAPYDFVRYTHFALSKMLIENGYVVSRFEAVYAPLYLVRVSTVNLVATLQPHPGLRGLIDRALLKALRQTISLIGRFGVCSEPTVTEIGSEKAGNSFPLGYQIEARKGSG